MVEILPSILAADFARLGEEIAKVERPALPCCTWTSWTAISSPTSHRNPGGRIHPQDHPAEAGRSPDDYGSRRYAPEFIRAGADHVLVHQEACPHLDRTLRMIRDEGALAGVVLNPATPIAMLERSLWIWWITC